MAFELDCHKLDPIKFTHPPVRYWNLPEYGKIFLLSFNPSSVWV